MAIKRKDLWRGTFSPLWWWGVSNLAWAFVWYLAFRDWKLFLAGMAIITLLLGMEAAYRIIRRKEQEYETRLITAKKEVEKDWEQQRIQRQERETVKLKERMEELLPAYLREKSMNLAGGYTLPPVDWFLDRMIKESPDLVRSAYSMWVSERKN